MADLVVIVPSRGRPDAARELIDAFRATCTADTFLIFAVDEDDPARAGYESVGDGISSGVMYTPSRAMVEALNFVASGYAEQGVDAIGFMGDDHRPRSVGWDSAYLGALREMGTGIVYGDDLLQGERLPTQCAMTSDIVRALGAMAPPGLRHMYVDNFWLDLGRAAGCIRYLPDVVVEHMHPIAGKADWSEGHQRVNDQAVFTADEQTYRKFLADEMPAVIGRIRLLMGRAPGGRVDPMQAPLTNSVDGHEWQLFAADTVPEYTRPEWYAGREHAPHLEQAGHRDRLMETARFVAEAAFFGKLKTVVDLGAGDGGLLSLLGSALTGWGYDLMPANLEHAKERGADVRFGDVIDGDIEWGDIAVCTEMLEHLVDPHAFVRRIAEHSRALVCSSPRLETAASHYEFHTWAWDLEGYRALVEQGGWRVLRQRRVHGFQVLLAVRP